MNLSYLRASIRDAAWTYARAVLTDTQMQGARKIWSSRLNKTYSTCELSKKKNERYRSSMNASYCMRIRFECYARMNTSIVFERGGAG